LGIATAWLIFKEFTERIAKKDAQEIVLEK
jgi:hypothetical protein